jgi:predicted transcriptional regulator
MGQGQDAVEAVSFLTSATARLRLLDHLRTGPATQGELQSALDLPQSTLARNLGKLRDRGWVVETGDGDDGSAREDDGRARYRLTVLGEATVVRGVRPVFMPAYIGVVAEIARSEGGDVLGMVPSHQLEAALADDDFDMGALTYGDAIEFRVWDGDIDYALAVLDDDLVLLTCDHAGGVPDLLVESRDPAVRRWAHGRIQAIYERSDPVSERV